MPYAFNPITNKLDLVGSGGGSATTDASLLTSGTLDNARLSPLVSLDNQNNNFTAGQTITAAANTSALTASISLTGANTAPVIDLTGTWNTTGVARGLRLNITNTASGNGSCIADFQLASVSRFQARADGLFYSANRFTCVGGYLISNSPDGSSSTAIFDATRVQLSAGHTLSWNVDTFLARDSANTLALRNGGTAVTPVPQNFRVYNWGDTTNYERGFMRWASNILEIGTEAGGTGTARRVKIQSAEAIDFVIAGSSRTITTGTGGTTISSTTNWLYYSGASDPTTATAPFNNGAGTCAVHRNTTTGAVKLWANNAGTLVSVALA